MHEIFLATECSGQHANISVYNAANGQNLVSFKGGSSYPRTLCLRTDEHIISAIPDRPIIQIYDASLKNQQPVKIPLPGVVRSLCASHDGLLLAAGIGNNVLLWELAGGELLGILSRHFQNVTCLAFSYDDSYLIASGGDGIVSLWDVGTVWDSELQNESCHSWTCHTLAVTQLKFGLRYRAYSSSLDCSVKIHDIPTRQTIMTVVFDAGVWSVDNDPSETILFVGCANGSLHKVNLLDCGHSSRLQLDSGDSARTAVNSAHSKAICCLSCSFDATVVITGSADSEIKFWDVASLQCLKTMKFGGVITNLLTIPTLPGLLSAANRMISPFPKLHRQVRDVGSDSDGARFKYFVIRKSKDTVGVVA